MAFPQTDSAQIAQTTLAILAGGEGARMGKAKAELTIGNRPILSYLLDRLAWRGPTLLVTAPGREHPSEWARFTAEVVDPQAEGPLRGILTALENIRTPLVAVLTVDMPCVEPEHVQWLIDVIEQQRQMMGLMLYRSVDESRQIEPFPSVYRCEAADRVRRRLERKQRSVQALLEEPQFASLPAPTQWPARIWTNLNYPQELIDFVAASGL